MADAKMVNLTIEGRTVSVPEGTTILEAAKHAVRAVIDVLRMELLGQPVRVSEIDPGMVETEFSIVRFGGDEAAAAKVYEGMTPLTADDKRFSVSVTGGVLRIDVKGVAGFGLLNGIQVIPSSAPPPSSGSAALVLNRIERDA